MSFLRKGLMILIIGIGFSFTFLTFGLSGLGAKLLPKFFAGFKIGGCSRSLFAWGVNKTVDGDMKTTKLAFVHGLVPHGPVLAFV